MKNVYFFSSGFGCEAVFLFCLFFIDSGIVALIFLTIGVGFSGFTISGNTKHYRFLNTEQNIKQKLFIYFHNMQRLNLKEKIISVIGS